MAVEEPDCRGERKDGEAFDHFQFSILFIGCTFLIFIGPEQESKSRDVAMVKVGRKARLAASFLEV
jgi:hypothetical protein